jgi:hypothetical protein
MRVVFMLRRVLKWNRFRAVSYKWFEIHDYFISNLFGGFTIRVLTAEQGEWRAIETHCNSLTASR